MEAESALRTFVFIGAGKMGEAIVAGWIKSQEGSAAALTARNFVMVERKEARRAYLEETYGVTCVGHAEEVERADVVVLAVKPQVMMEAIAGFAHLKPFAASLYISIAAGLTTQVLVDALPKGSRLVRVMPNLPLVVGAGASGVCASRTSTSEDVEKVSDLFACLGVAELVSEDKMDVVGALSGSGPAYVAALIEALVHAGQQQGLSEEISEALVLQTVYGTAKQLKETGQKPAQLREAVCSPGGTTLAALGAMEKAGLALAYDQGVVAAVRRSKELGSC